MGTAALACRPAKPGSGKLKLVHSHGRQGLRNRNDAGMNQNAKTPLLSIRHVAKAFGKNPVLRDISLEIAEGEFLTILGESGSGKTTSTCESSPDLKTPTPAKF